MKSFVIDEEGFPLMDEFRLKDEKEGRALIGPVEWKQEGFFQVPGTWGMVQAEPFDVPWVIRHVTVGGKGILAELLFGITIDFHPEVLWTDEWDRFRGHAGKDIPFVFSRTAQMEFFELLESYDDESITWDGIEIMVPTKEDLLEGLTARASLTPGVHSSLIDMIPRLKLPKSRILCVLSPAEEDISNFFSKDGHIASVKRVEPGHAFSKPKEKEEYDFIFVSRDALRFYTSGLKLFFKTLKSHLGLQGTLFVVGDVGEFHWRGKNIIPELTEWELREAVKKDFDFLFWGRWKLSPPPWDAREVFFYAQKKRDQ
ncbi:MAG: hypothetical protein V4736_00470 [Bdellovibrionota bacterium]